MTGRSWFGDPGPGGSGFVAFLWVSQQYKRAEKEGGACGHPEKGLKKAPRDSPRGALQVKSVPAS